MGFHTPDEQIKRDALTLGLLQDERAARLQEAHDKDAWRGRCLFVEQWCEAHGWRLATAEESQYLQMVPVIEDSQEQAVGLEDLVAHLKKEVGSLNEQIENLQKANSELARKAGSEESVGDADIQEGDQGDGGG